MIIVQAPNFRLHKYHRFGSQKTSLFIFSNDNKTQGYSFYWDNKSSRYRCSQCRINGITITATIRPNSNSADYVALSSNNHVCNPTEYHRELYQNDENRAYYYL